MPKFKDLFCFSKLEVDSAFKKATLLKKIDGLKLLRSAMGEAQTHGKLLIITPRAMGKAHLRNLMRRQLKAIYYENKLYTNTTTLILLVYKAATELTFEELKAFLISASQDIKTV